MVSSELPSTDSRPSALSRLPHFSGSRDVDAPEALEGPNERGTAVPGAARAYHRLKARSIPTNLGAIFPLS